ncbi:MAG: phage antirepressor KilAC domain-containing protein [Bacteroidaceae bacterium]|nr:phage antirepressor KilAC domain-containing protein [Bacteroidaceae bacterium]
MVVQHSLYACTFFYMLNNRVEIFQYNGSPVTFQKGDSVMVNATEMAKAFDKRPIIWLQSKSTEEFLNELSKVRNLTLADLVQVTRGGDNPGTWMHEDVALEFARWLSPAFSIWCNDHIKELLTTGVTTAGDDDAAIAHAMEILNRRLEQAKAEKLMLEAKAQEQERVIKEQAPKVEYHDAVLTSTITYTVTQIAKEFGCGAETLNRKLRERGVQYKQSGQWLLYAKYQDKGYTKTITRQYTGATGQTHTSQLTVWTEAGRRFIHSLFD